MRAAIFFLVWPAFSQVSVAPPGTSCSSVTVAMSQQSSRVWAVRLVNRGRAIQFPRAMLLVEVPGVPALLKSQVANWQSNSGWSVLARTGQEMATLAPAALSAAGIAANSPNSAWAGLAVSLLGYFVTRAQARATPSSDELPDAIAIPAQGGAEYRMHTAKMAPQQAVKFEMQVCQ